MSEHRTEIAQGRRFEFGANWSRFLSEGHLEKPHP